MSLREYVRKRDFAHTQEPRGKGRSATANTPRFVIQKHAASHLHYDLRLEVSGTLKSWALPKGVPYTQREKRLAVQVEDHPLDYAAFEGVIPQGQYGGGTVMVWDTGTYEMLSGSARKGLGEGKLHFIFHGAKLTGEWVLVRIRDDDQRQWLLLKSGASMRPPSKPKDDESVLTGRSMAQIRQDRDAEWQSDKKSSDSSELSFLPPMKAKAVSAPPRSGHWRYELKFDGYRALALKQGKRVRLLSTNGKDFTTRFTELAQAIGQLGVRDAIIDGEIVALDAEGRSSFQLLQQSELNVAATPLAFYAFDLLRIGGKNIVAESLAKRREQLEKVVSDSNPFVRFSADLGTDPNALLAEVKRLGLEGIIGKKAESSYEPGKRSGAWIKLKCLNEQEFVIGGYTPPEGSRKYLGALLVGYFERGALVFAGKVGTGFDFSGLRSLYHRFQGLRRADCPFSNLPEKRDGRWSRAITTAELRRCHWLDPLLVCQVRFAEWTQEGKLRHPVFLGLREDKSAQEVRREPAAGAPKRPVGGARRKAKR